MFLSLSLSLSFFLTLSHISCVVPLVGLKLTCSLLCVGVRVCACIKIRQNSSSCECVYAPVHVCQGDSEYSVAVVPVRGLKDAHHCEQHGQQHKRQSVMAALCLIASHCFERCVHSKTQILYLQQTGPCVYLWICGILLSPDITCITCFLFA